MKKLILFFVLSISSPSFAQVIPASNRVDWSHAGHEGVIPDPSNIVDVTGFGAVGDSLTDNHGFILTAISSLNGNRGVIYFPPGNYLVLSTINLPDSVILRGASSDSTHLIFDFAGSAGNCINIAGQATFPFTNILYGFAKGSPYVVVADTSGFAMNDDAEIQEDNGNWDTQPVSWADHSVGQIVRINHISSDTLFFNQPLRIQFDSTLNVQIRKFVAVKEIGIECLGISRRDNVTTGVCFNMYLDHAVNCWIRGIESSLSIGSHVEADACSHIELSGNYIHHAFAYDGISTHGYGITMFKHTGDCKLENNILRHLRHSFSLQCGANGNVIAYNYSLDPNRSEFPSNLGADISLHGHYSFANLFEGNVVQNIQVDQTWGPSGQFNTFFRNRADLYGILMTSGTVNSDSENFVGNEIPNTGTFLGNYAIAGTGHVEYGNNVRGVITPAGTTVLNDSSYYLSSTPAYWNITSSWPSIGEPNLPGIGSIPAKERFASGTNLTACVDPIISGFFQNDFVDIKIYPNPVRDLLFISGDYISGKVNITLMNLFGEILFATERTSSQNKFKSQISTTSLAAGMYFLKLSGDQKSVIIKFIKYE